MTRLLGKRIEALRERQGLDRESLALRVGCAPDELARIENGEAEAPPMARLLDIADALQLKKAADFVSLVQLGGSSRRIHAYCLGLPKTGTVSLYGIFRGYRSAHEFQQWETHQAIIRCRRGRLSRNELRTFVMDRDRAGRLEMDAAHFNRHYTDILAEEYPEAVFIYLIRDPFSWVNSMINYFTEPHREAGHSRELPNGMPFDLPMGACEAKRKLSRDFPRYIDWPLSFWASENRAMLARRPPGRSLLIRTHEISDSIGEMARLAGAPVNSLSRERSHLNRAPYRVRVLNRCDRGFLREKFHQHCGELLEAFFPGYTLDDFFENRPIPPHPGLADARVRGDAHPRGSIHGNHCREEERRYG